MALHLHEAFAELDDIVGFLLRLRERTGEYCGREGEADQGTHFHSFASGCGCDTATA
jgi:hypothetical protein